MINNKWRIDVQYFLPKFVASIRRSDQEVGELSGVEAGSCPEAEQEKRERLNT